MSQASLGWFNQPVQLKETWGEKGCRSTAKVLTGSPLNAHHSCWAPHDGDLSSEHSANWNKDDVFSSQISVETQPECVFFNASGDGVTQTSFWRWLIFSDRFLGRRKQAAVCCCCGMCYICLNGAITFAGESCVVGHNDTQDIAIWLEPQQWPDHNETATLYLGPVLHNRAFPGVASHEQEKPKSTEVQDFHNSLSWPLPLPLGLDQFVVHLLMYERQLNGEWRRVAGGGVSTWRAAGGEKWGQCNAIHSRSLIETKTLQYVLLALPHVTSVETINFQNSLFPRLRGNVLCRQRRFMAFQPTFWTDLYPQSLPEVWTRMLFRALKDIKCNVNLISALEYFSDCSRYERLCWKLPL